MGLLGHAVNVGILLGTMGDLSKIVGGAPVNHALPRGSKPIKPPLLTLWGWGSKTIWRFGVGALNPIGPLIEPGGAASSSRFAAVEPGGAPLIEPK